MSNKLKEDFLVGAIGVFIVTLLTIFFGNTGSGFFRNLFIIVVAVLLGTPLAVFIKKIISMFTENALYIYMGDLFLVL